MSPKTAIFCNNNLKLEYLAIYIKPKFGDILPQSKIKKKIPKCLSQREVVKKILRDMAVFSLFIPMNLIMPKENRETIL